MLTSYEFDGDNIPFIKGSALKALEAVQANPNVKRGENMQFSRTALLIGSEGVEKLKKHKYKFFRHRISRF